jgi:hypothetical protein
MSSQIAVVLPEPGGPSSTEKSGVPSVRCTKSRCSLVPSRSEPSSLRRRKTQACSGMLREAIASQRGPVAIRRSRGAMRGEGRFSTTSSARRWQSSGQVLGCKKISGPSGLRVISAASGSSCSGGGISVGMRARRSARPSRSKSRTSILLSSDQRADLP